VPFEQLRANELVVDRLAVVTPFQAIGDPIDQIGALDWVDMRALAESAKGLQDQRASAEGAVIADVVRVSLQSVGKGDAAGLRHGRRRHDQTAAREGDLLSGPVFGRDKGVRAAAMARCICLFLSVAVLMPTAHAGAKLPVLTTVRQVRALSLEEAKLEYPVKLSGVVTVLSGSKNSFFFADETAGISIDRNDVEPEVQSGDRVEVLGVSEPGFFAPSVTSNQVRILDHGKLPPAPLKRFEEIQGGALDSQWIEIRGVVHAASIAESWGRQVLFLETDVGGGSVTVRVHDFPTIDPESFIDAEISVRGVCGTKFNGRRQFIGLRLFVASLRDVTIERAPPPDPFALPLRGMQSVLTFGTEGAGAHRIKIAGTVTYQRLGSGLYLQQGDEGIYVQTTQATLTPPGTQVEAVGFAAAGAYSPTLESAKFKVVGSAEPPAARKANAREMIGQLGEGFPTAPYDSLLVRTDGWVVERLQRAGDEVVVLKDGDRLFRAIVKGGARSRALQQLRAGSKIAVVGICSMQADERREPQSFEILTRSAADVTPLESPSWWNVGHAVRVLGIALLAVLVSVAWIVSLRKRVKESTAELSRAHAHLNAVLNAATLVSIIATDKDGLITVFNSGAERMLGYTAGEMIGKTTPAMLHAASEINDGRKELSASTGRQVSDFEVLVENLQNGRGAERECIYVRKDGQHLVATLASTAVHDEQGEITGYLGIAMDITERKKAESELHHAIVVAEEANRSKSQFLANMSHEIRTPMNGILGMTELTLDTELSREQRDNLGLVKVSAESLLTVLNDILDFSKIEAGKLEFESIPFDLRASMSDALQTLSYRVHQKGLELICDVHAEVPESLVGDPGRLRQIVVNLIGNAIKFTEKGEIVVSVTEDAAEDGRVCLHVSVADTGIGIPVDRQKKIFEAFSQADGSTNRKFGGTGLGLTISTRLVDMMGGKIWVESEPGKGSTFHFTAWLGMGEKTTPPATVDRSQLRDLSILVVDDNFASRRVLQGMLSGWGAKPVLTASSQEALDLMEAMARDGQHFPVAIVDGQMPSIDGFALVQRMQERSQMAATKTVMLTSMGQRGDASRCREVGIAGYLLKPVRQSELLEMICRVLQPSPPSEAPALETRHTLREGRRRLQILLAEDNLINQTIAVRLLEKRGYVVTVAGDGRAVLSAIEKQSFDMVLMDVQMPEMDGLQATAAIRQREQPGGHRLPILAMTANAFKEDEERCIAAGMDGYVAKPIRPADLFAAIEKVTDDAMARPL
jgi:PAS domain S-box-containing protein